MGSGAYFIHFLQRSAGLHTLVLLLQLKAMSAIEMEKKNIFILAGLCNNGIHIQINKAGLTAAWWLSNLSTVS